jgi:hypothetical protein
MRIAVRRELTALVVFLSLKVSNFFGLENEGGRGAHGVANYDCPLLGSRPHVDSQAVTVDCSQLLRLRPWHSHANIKNLKQAIITPFFEPLQISVCYTVNIVTSYGLDCLGFESPRRKRFPLLQDRPEWLWTTPPPPTSYSMGTGVLCWV